jgi:hypothetical protein
MNSGAQSLKEATEWLQKEIAQSAYGRISIGVQVHAGEIVKVFRTVEEVTVASQPTEGKQKDGQR